MRIEGHVGPSTVQDGVEGISLRQSRGGELVATQLHGKYYEQCSRGNVFYATGAATGMTIPIQTTTTNTPTLFNPLGSNVNCSLIRLALSYVGATCVPGGIVLGYTLNCGSSQATGGAITVFTDIASTNALIGSQNVAKARFSTTNTFTAQPTVYSGAGIGLTTMTPAATNNPNIIIVDFDGTLVLSPGNAVSVTATAATVATFIPTLSWEEVPI